MVIDPPEPYRHKDGTIVHLVEINQNDWYCWAKYPDGNIKPVSEDIFFRDFESIIKAASKS
ncbi:hypothetical protein CN445_19115 [Bacillus cereus]|nr:hypothetical protein CON44_33040 [Bacillus cereus]PER12912.1 hypothetical protein CN485_30910 [Bacillus cereus]PEW85051.1 hypothetical protein CN445_19115 [Bacillus cereus]PEX82270.1 hypothetical protein CN465_32190 [Bacillus cereus]PFK10613.1 hypothetical protein COJ05_28750 [Bacillus cereus]